MRYCAVEVCDRQVHARGLCSAHLERSRKHGSPGFTAIARKAPQRALIEFLFTNKDHQGAGCLLWPFAKYENGYGEVCFDGKRMSASRAMCLIAHGEPPTPEHQAAHSCGNGDEACVHPGHVYWATAQQNQLDRRAHGTDMRGDKHPAAVLDAATVLRLRREMQGRKNYTEVARAFGVCGPTIRKAVLGISWSHI